jgi:tRNA dimethylallyltransferase
MEKPKIVAIVGPTASGKSLLGIQLAQRFKGEIISSDSVQVYRGLNIGSGKLSLDQRCQIPHHLIDILDLHQTYSAALFRQQADIIIHELHGRKSPIVVVGGTGLYLKVLTRGLFEGPACDPGLRLTLHKRAETEGRHRLYRELQRVDPEAALKIHPQDILRIVRAMEVFYRTCLPISKFQHEHGFQEKPYEVFKVGLSCGKEEMYKRIEARTDAMIKMGWVGEVRSLLHQGYPPGLKPLRSIGYKHVVAYLTGNLTFQEAIDFIKRDTRRYAKRQLTWFKADPEIQWYPAQQESFATILKDVGEFLSNPCPEGAVLFLKQRC